MIIGAHAIIYSEKADEVREFLRDILDLRSVDAGRGWLIFALPPAEVAVHPGQGPGSHELYLLCDDLGATMAELTAKGVEFGPLSEERWGRLTSIKLPGGDALPLYEPTHPIAIERP